MTCLLVLGQLQQVVVGDGRLASACGTDEEHGDIVGQEQVQEEFLANSLCCLDDHVTQLEKQTNKSQFPSLTRKHHRQLNTKFNSTCTDDHKL